MILLQEKKFSKCKKFHVKIFFKETNDFAKRKVTLSADTTYVKHTAKEVKNYNVRGAAGGIVNILRGGSMDYSE